MNEAYLTDTIQAQLSTNAIFWNLFIFIYIFLNLAFKNFYMFQNEFADFKNPIVLYNMIFNMNVTFEIVLWIVTGLKYFNHYWLWKSNKSFIKDKEVNLYGNEPESSIKFNLVVFSTNICFQMYLFIGNFEIKNKSLNKQVLCGALSCSVVFRVIRTLLRCSNMIRGAPGVIHCSFSAPSAIIFCFAPLFPWLGFY